MIDDKDLRRTGLALADVDVDDQWLHEEHAAGQPATRRGTWNEAEAGPLFDDDVADQFRAEWLELQSRFVDDPNVSVREADELVSQLIRNITTALEDKRLALERQWKQGDKQATEDLRVALQRYRSFFQRLLALES